MKRHYGFLPLALVFFLAASVGPMFPSFNAFLTEESAREKTLSYALSREIGGQAIVSGPVLKVPVVGTQQTDNRAEPEIRLNPSQLDIRIIQSTEEAMIDGYSVPWHLNKVAMTARFEMPDDIDVLMEGESLNWQAARLYLPSAYPKTIRSGPTLTIGGEPVAFNQVAGRNIGTRFETAAIGFPEDTVTLSLDISYAKSVLDIFPTGWTTEVTMVADSLAPSFDDVKPEWMRYHWLGRTMHWTLDGTKSEGKATRKGFEKNSNEGFLGITMREPDGTGPATVYSDRTNFTYDRYAVLLPIVRLAFAVTALALLATGLSQYSLQLGLFFVWLTTTATALFLAPRIGPHAAWNVASIAFAIGSLAVFVVRGWKVAGFIALIGAGLWLAIWQTTLHSRIPTGVTLSTVAREFGQLILFLLFLLALVAAGVQSLFRRLRPPAK